MLKFESYLYKNIQAKKLRWIESWASDIPGVSEINKHKTTLKEHSINKATWDFYKLEKPNQNKSNRPEDEFITEKLQTVWGKWFTVIEH